MFIIIIPRVILLKMKFLTQTPGVYFLGRPKLKLNINIKMPLKQCVETELYKVVYSRPTRYKLTYIHVQHRVTTCSHN